MATAKKFALIGAAGYIAPRHMEAIQETGNNLVAALDKFDCVGIMDRFFPDASFFTEPERFDRHLDKLRRLNKGYAVDFVSICTPNYLHDSHIRLALRNNAHAICEKPVVLNPWNVDALQILEQETKKDIYTILQLRLHPSVIELKKKVENGPKDKIYDIDLSYITSRGKWYDISWKGDISKSGGITTNIGVHFFDMLSYVFGKPKKSDVHLLQQHRASGYIELEKARVRWFLSIDSNDIPSKKREQGQSTFRSILMEGEEFEFSGGFTDLHTISYQKILEGTGFRIEEARQSTEMVHHIRNTKQLGLKGNYHPLLKSITI
ncbi:MAG: Gfo/Idh/MocA family oxidoreductase [Bacteroidales bacterium]|jgi:UDP-N-acetyl-2-amino-2-deoxyglucuronate dehydrogenase|nr:Gfo/Idh/MocA family oxidoreductase [Bacteroidales bacterium]